MAGLRVAGWKTEAGQRAYLDLYEQLLASWPVTYQSRLVATRFGETHVVISGGEALPPLVLLHAGTGFGVAQWMPNIAELALEHRVYAVETVGAPGKSIHTKPVTTRADCADWLADLFDGLELTAPAIAGSSQGGWFALNLALLKPERVGVLVLLAPAAAIAPFKFPVGWFIKCGSKMPAWTAGPTFNTNFKDPSKIRPEYVALIKLHMKHYRYQQKAIIPFGFPTEELPGLQPPTLLLIGTREMVYEPRKTLERAERLIPDIEAELVPDAGHVMNMEIPHLISSRILDFLGAHKAAK
jgi:pimeloyl-ACP methyl ester carboxylesterase